MRLTKQATRHFTQPYRHVDQGESWQISVTSVVFYAVVCGSNLCNWIDNNKSLVYYLLLSTFLILLWPSHNLHTGLSFFSSYNLKLNNIIMISMMTYFLLSFFDSSNLQSMVDCLLSLGASPSLHNRDGDTSLHLLAKRYHYCTCITFINHTVTCIRFTRFAKTFASSNNDACI